MLSMSKNIHYLPIRYTTEKFSVKGSAIFNKLKHALIGHQYLNILPNSKTSMKQQLLHQKAVKVAAFSAFS